MKKITRNGRASAILAQPSCAVEDKKTLRERFLKKNNSQWQGERNLGAAKLRRRGQKTLAVERDYLAADKRGTIDG